MGKISFQSRTSRADLAAIARGFKGETFDLASCQGNQVLTTQQVEYTMVGLYAGEVITNVVTSLGTNGGTLSLVKYGIYSSAGTLLASTADSNASFTSGAPKFVSVALSAAYTVPADGGYYFAVLAVGTTGPALSYGSPVSATTSQFGAGPRAHGNQGAQADLPSPTATVGNSGANLRRFWFGWS